MKNVQKIDLGLTGYLPLTKVNKDNGLSTLRRTPLPLKSERCFCTASEHRDQKFPPVFPVPSTEALPDLSPVAAPPIA